MYRLYVFLCITTATYKFNVAVSNVTVLQIHNINNITAISNGTAAVL